VGRAPAQPRADSNCRYRLERAASWATRRRGQNFFFLRARGGGLEPPKAEPESAVLPITPPPKGADIVADGQATPTDDFGLMFLSDRRLSEKQEKSRVSATWHSSRD
jgi:hypothetical protein